MTDLTQIPDSVVQAERTVSRWFAERNLSDWQLGDSRSRAYVRELTLAQIEAVYREQWCIVPGEAQRPPPTPLPDMVVRFAHAIARLCQRPGAQAASEPDKDSRWSIDRAADFLEQYAAFIEREKSDDIEQHPYLPELQYVAGQLRRWFAPAGERPAQAEPLMRMVPLSLLVRAREHAPYMGETWKALNEAMTTLGAQAPSTAAPAPVWQTTDSPPPDGVAVLVRCPDTNPEADVPWRYDVARYESKRALHHWWSATSSLPHAFLVSPSHWQAIAH